MGAKTKISWTNATWSPIRARVREDARAIAAARGYTSLLPIIQPGRVGPHCEHVSPGCENCYSETNNGRCLPYNGTGLPFDRRARELVDICIDEKILRQPLRWRRPRKIFVCSQTDLFGEFVPDELIDRVFAVMALCPHTFQVLTKRAGRMRDYCSSDATVGRLVQLIEALTHGIEGVSVTWSYCDDQLAGIRFPNIWLGVSVEDQPTADERIPLLLQTPAAVRFVSAEPLLGPVDFSPYLSGYPHVDWVIPGGESGPGARSMHPDWVRSARDQCQTAGIPFFFKQWGEYCTPDQLPERTLEKFEIQPEDEDRLLRFGRKASGRLLDGVEWSQFPGGASMIRHRLLDASGRVIAEFEREGALPDNFEQRAGGKSYQMQYCGTEDGVRVYVESAR